MKMNDDNFSFCIKVITIVLLSLAAITIVAGIAQAIRSEYLVHNVDDEYLISERMKHDAEEAAVSYVECNVGHVEKSDIVSVKKIGDLDFVVLTKCVSNNEEIIVEVSTKSGKENITSVLRA